MQPTTRQVSHKHSMLTEVWQAFNSHTPAKEKKNAMVAAWGNHHMSPKLSNSPCTNTAQRQPTGSQRKHA